jgi:hypothetical protein
LGNREYVVLARVLPQLKIKHVRRVIMHDIMLKANQLLSLVLSTGATRSNGRKGIILWHLV